MNEKDTSKIPKGLYCYEPISVDPQTGRLKIKTCPYWSCHPEYGIQNRGSCSYLNLNDWDSEKLTHLWDQVKECDINMEIDKDDLKL